MIDASNHSFNLAKQQIMHGLEKLARFSAAMDMKYPAFGFNPFAKKLRNLGNILQESSGPCLSSDKINEVEKFARHLSSNQEFIKKYFIDTGFLFRLEKFWDLRYNILNAGNKTKDIILWRLHGKAMSQNTMDEIGQSIRRAGEVKNTTDQIVEAVLNQQPKNILAIISFLLALIIRVEVHEYEINNMIKTAKKYTKINYDIDELLSVHSKVKKRNGWRSDARAIRDAVSHAHFTINNVSTGYKIHFKNTEEGYNFDRIFSEKDILLFYQDYVRLIAIQTTLLNSALITDFLRREFKK